MELGDAATHLIDALAGSGPIWLIAFAIIGSIVYVVIKGFPFWKEFKLKQLDIEADREKRKSEEAQMRHEREKEAAIIQARMVDAQEAQTAAVNGVQAQIAIMNGRLEASQHGSQHMGEKVDTMATQVHEMHGVIMKDK